MRIVKDEIGPTLKALQVGLESTANVLAVANAARMVIINRTLHEKLDLNRQPFAAYGTKRYYAPVDKRPPGYPAPSGGRTTALKGGRKLKTVAYDEGYGDYKAGLGLGSAPQLSVSNRMLSDIQARVASAKSAVLFFGSRLSAAKAHGHHTGKRPFFGIHLSEQANLYKVLADQLVLIKGVTK